MYVELDGSGVADHLDKLLAAFSATVDGAIERVKSEWLQVRDEEHPDGMFDFDFSLEERHVYGKGADSDVDVDEVIDRISSRSFGPARAEFSDLFAVPCARTWQMSYEMLWTQLGLKCRRFCCTRGLPAAGDCFLPNRSSDHHGCHR